MVVISSDLDELVDVCDRVAVLDAGRIAGIVANGPGAETRIGELIVGASNHARAGRVTEATLAPDPGIETAARIPGGGRAGPMR